MNRGLIGKIAAVVFVLGSVIFWIWAFSPLAPNDNPDRIPDREFPVAAEAQCAESLERIDVISAGVFDLNEPFERAAIVDEATTELDALVERLDAEADAIYADLAVGVSDNGRLDDLDEWRTVIDRWLDDWRIYLGDRRDHAERLRTEGDVELLLSLVGNIDVAERLTGFARVNDMSSCEVPGDL